MESFGNNEEITEPVEAVKTPDQMGSVELFNYVRDELGAKMEQLVVSNRALEVEPGAVATALSGPEADSMRREMQQLAEVVKKQESLNPSDVILGQTKTILQERYSKLAPGDKPLF